MIDSEISLIQAFPGKSLLDVRKSLLYAQAPHRLWLGEDCGIQVFFVFHC